MDLATILVSTAVSVIASTVVTLLTVPTIAVRQARAGVREDARRRIRAVASSLELDLARYQAGLTPKRTGDVGHGDDTDGAAKIISAAQGLGRMRHRLVLRRCRIIFGHWADTAMLYPGESDSGQRFVGTLLAGAVDRGEAVDVTSHVLHQAYSHPPGHRSQRQLARQLRLLSRAR